jgi:hypothetical protein
MTWPAEGSDPTQQRPQDPQSPSSGAPQPPQAPGGYPTSGSYPGEGQAYGQSPGYEYGTTPYGQTPAEPYAGGQQYAYPGYQAPARGTNTMAILALVLAFVFAPLGIVFGHMARRQIRQTHEQGDGLALAGLILGYIGTGLAVLACAIGVIALIAAGNSGTSGY